MELNGILAKNVLKTGQKKNTYKNPTVNWNQVRAKVNTRSTGNVDYIPELQERQQHPISQSDINKLPITSEQRKSILTAINKAVEDFYGKDYDPNVPKQKTYDISGNIFKDIKGYNIGPMTLQSRPYIDIFPIDQNTKPIKIFLDDLPQATIKFPECNWLMELKFRWVGTETGSRLESANEGDFPVINLDFAEKRFTDLNTLIKWEFAPANNSLQAYDYYTRLTNLIISKRLIYISFKDIIKIDIAFEEFPKETKQHELQVAAMYRKLAFISKVIKQPILIPNVIEEDDIEVIEIVFFALAVGSFNFRTKQTVLPPIKLSREQVLNPPFTRPASIGYSVQDTSVNLLGVTIPLGDMKVYISQAKLMDNTIIDKVFKDPNKEYSVSFAAMNHDIIYEFKNFLKPKILERNSKILTKFINRLKGLETKEVLEAIQWSLYSSIDEQEAKEIAQGWLEFNMLSNNFKVGEPLAKPSSIGENWQLPVYWVSKEVVKGKVGVINVNCDSGDVTTEPTLKEIRLKSMRLASSSLREETQLVFLQHDSKQTESQSYYLLPYHRDIIEIKAITGDSNKKKIAINIPSWKDKEIEISSEIIEDANIVANLEVGMKLLATINLGAISEQELDLKHFTLLKKGETDDNI